MAAIGAELPHQWTEADVKIASIRSRIIAGGLAAWSVLGCGAPAHAAPALSSTAAVRAALADDIVQVRWRGVHVPPGILAAVPSGGSPWGPPLRPHLLPYSPVYNDPHFWPPPLPILVAPLPILFEPPFGYDWEPFAWPAWPFDGGCFVQSDHAGQHGYWGSCEEALYRQWTDRPD